MNSFSRSPLWASSVQATETYLDETSQSRELFERSVALLPDGNSRTTITRLPYAPYMSSGSGQWIRDVDGDERIDFINNYTTLIHGHSHPVIVERAKSAVDRLLCAAFPTEAETVLATELVSRLEGAEKIRFTNSGSEAVMLALRVARAATGRPGIAKFEGCYHGAYDDVMVSLSAPAPDSGPIGRPTSVFGPGLARTDPPTLVLPFNQPQDMRALIEEHASTLAAVIVDLAPNRIGLPQATPALVETLREVTSAHGIVLIFDEVMTFRAARGGFQSTYGVVPDLTVLGKIIGGGFPIGAVAGAAEFLDVLSSINSRHSPHGGTFNGNPVAMNAGAASVELLTDNAFKELSGLTSYLAEELETGWRRMGRPGYVNRVGSLFQLHLRTDAVTDYRSYTADPSAAARVRSLSAGLLANGIALATNGLGCVSTVMNRDDVDYFVEQSLRLTAAG